MIERDDVLSTSIQVLDNALFEQVKGINILDAVAPQNFRQEKQAFFASNFSQSPVFTYATKPIDAFRLKRDLFNLPIDELGDDDLVTLYSSVIESYVDKIDQYKSIGTADFLYDSLRYYGEPSEKDCRNANFILHLPDLEESNDTLLGAADIVAKLEAFAQAENYQYQIKLEDSLIANALVSGTTVKVNRAALISETEANALAHHELGVHLVTTLNARSQPLRVLGMGSPVNTMTQEGLAILSEYLAGFMTLPRLKVLALRVLAVKSMIEEKDFKKTFLLLKEQHHVADEQAFTITARVYRGGGLCKDYLYLQGLHQMLNAYETRTDFNNLLSGKVSIAQLPLITRLIDKGYLHKPRLLSPAIARPVENDAVQQFITHAIK
ncbi:flavohemoglobin expression-modulating QEGLA motif protein [Amphritea sp. 1_MG-2023]|uniref:flavohemoglobin expression-modulating QEGLA motif protein n=1 Tax=Amphritea sp. 1_MG-2023 TaxID=3062670 RepID=UPI0026E21FFB|nr:flavohemoglobin expression-modulating QEGLA motif protein [Amphritea sp. 1_MG-2023]MDO6563075.1 flavohemoglobin expression-modulating QEGLA motif protein [Amphritea sp. 1_MG-2023]